MELINYLLISAFVSSSLSSLSSFILLILFCIDTEDFR
jgi:hypothetical protein